MMDGTANTQNTEFRATRVDPETVLVAIPTLNEEAHIETTLTALLADAPQMQQVKLVVADGGSTDATCDIVRKMAQSHPNIHLIHNPAKLQSAAVNLVVDECAEPQHDILVRVDAHSYYPTGYVLAVADSLIEHDVAALATVMDSVGPSCFQRGSAWAMETKVGSGGSGHRGGTESGYVDHGHHAGFRLDIWREVGGYNTGFVANEDAELDHRIGLAGGKIWLDATIRLDYVMRPTLGKLGKQYWRYGKGRAQTILEHKMKPRPRQVIPPVIVAFNILALILSLAIPALLIVPALYLVMLAAVTLQLIAKKKSLCALCAGPALLVMHHTWGLGFITQMLGGAKR
jgi:succinoglycan biosynthesis protein ExoA